MPEKRLLPAIRAALRANEIGNRTPYELSFAGKGKSGASYGFMQGDVYAGPSFVKDTLARILREEGLKPPKVDSILALLSQPCIANPLSAEETNIVNGGLSKHRMLVDAMDDNLAGRVYAGLDSCLRAARASGRTIRDEALLYMGLWINMTGAPTRLLTWLSGQSVRMRTLVGPPGNDVDGATMRAYLQATDYFFENPKNFKHMEESVHEGMLEDMIS